MRRPYLATVHVLIVSLAVNGFAAGEDTHWQCVIGNWSEDACWTSGKPEPGNDAYVTNGGTVEINQSREECRSLHLGGYQDGFVYMTGGDLWAGSAFLFPGSGQEVIFHQEGGWNVISAQLHLANSSGSTATYELMGTDSELKVGDEDLRGGEVWIGIDGVGKFDHRGSAVSRIYGDLKLGNYSRNPWTGKRHYGIGTYVLREDGHLYADNENVGYEWLGTFEQGGATTNEVHPGFAYVEGTQQEYRCLFSVPGRL